MGMGIVFLALSLFYGHSSAYAAAFLFVSILSLSVVLTRDNAADLSIEAATESLYGYEDGQDWRLGVRNVGRAKKFMLSIGGPLEDVGPGCGRLLAFSTKWTRGIHRGDVVLRSFFPFGLFEAGGAGRSFRFVIAAKRENRTPLGLEDFRLPGAKGGGGGTKPGGQEFMGLREYVEGDPVGGIDWKRSSPDKTLVRTYGESPSEGYLIDEAIIGGRVPNREDVLVTLSYFADRCAASGVTYALKFGGSMSPFGRGRAHDEDVVGRLALGG